MLSSAVLVLAAAMLGQADHPPSTYEHLKDLEYFVGTWIIEGEIKIEGEFAGLSDVAGRPLRSLMSYEWFKNKNFLSVTMREDAKYYGRGFSGA